MRHYARTFILVLLLVSLTACGSAAARYNNAGNNDYQSEDYAAALKNYTDAKQENPDLAEPYYNSGNVYHRQGDLEAAEVQTKQSIRTAKRNENGAIAQAGQYNLGNNYFESQNWPEAVKAYEEALRVDPTDEDAKYNLELALQQEQQEQQQQGSGGGPPPPPGEQEQQDQGGQGEDQNQGQGEDQEQQGDGGGQQDQEQPGQSGSEPSDQNQNPGDQRGLTPEEAERLLDALGQDSQTLQERLQEGFFAPGLPPAEDW